MNKKSFKFEIGEEILDHNDLKRIIAERKVNKQFGHNEYRLKGENLPIWHAESHLKSLK